MNIDVGGAVFIALGSAVVIGLSALVGLRMRKRQTGQPTMAAAWWVLSVSIIASALCLRDVQHLWWLALFVLVSGSLSSWEFRRLIKKRQAEAS